ncbi:recombinase family protein, partial [Primorskyibacter flagellatus]
MSGCFFRSRLGGVLFGLPAIDLLLCALGGTRKDRPGLQSLLEAVKARACDIVLVENIDRLSRNQEELHGFYNRTKHAEAEIYTTSRGRMDSLTLGLSSLIAATYLEDLAQRTKRGLEGKHADGLNAGGKAYGYRVRRTPEGVIDKGQLEIIETEALVVRRIFREYAAGKSPIKIAAGLNKDGIPAPKPRKNAKFSHWRQTTINGNPDRGNGILNNELYIGRSVWDRLRYSKDPETGKRVSRLNPLAQWSVAEVPHLRIIKDELWQAVKDRQTRQRARYGKTDPGSRNDLSMNRDFRRRRFLLSGLFECGRCGGNMTVAGSGKYKAYYCANAKEKGATICEGMPGLKIAKATPTVLAALRDLIMTDEDYETFRERLQVHLATLGGAKQEEQVLLDTQIAEIEGKRENLVRAVEDSYHPTLIERLKEVEQSLSEKLAAVAVLEAEAPQLPEDLSPLYRELIDNLTQTLQTEGVIGRAADELRGMIDRIVVSWDQAHRMDLQGNLLEMLKKAKPAELAGLEESASSLELVAGVGFEPT